MAGMDVRNGKFVALLMLAVTVITLSGCSADCSWNGKTEAFVDENANAIWDVGEPPLADVTFTLFDRSDNSLDGSWISDNSGKATVSFFVQCDEKSDFAVYAAPPEGYDRERFGPIVGGSEVGKTYSFGFMRKK